MRAATIVHGAVGCPIGAIARWCCVDLGAADLLAPAEEGLGHSYSDAAPTVGCGAIWRLRGLTLPRMFEGLPQTPETPVQLGAAHLL